MKIALSIYFNAIIILFDCVNKDDFNIPKINSINNDIICFKFQRVWGRELKTELDNDGVTFKYTFRYDENLNKLSDGRFVFVAKVKCAAFNDLIPLMFNIKESTDSNIYNLLPLANNNNLFYDNSNDNIYNVLENYDCIDSAKCRINQSDLYYFVFIDTYKVKITDLLFSNLQLSCRWNDYLISKFYKLYGFNALKSFSINKYIARYTSKSIFKFTNIIKTYLIENYESNLIQDSDFKKFIFIYRNKYDLSREAELQSDLIDYVGTLECSKDGEQGYVYFKNETDYKLFEITYSVGIYYFWIKNLEKVNYNSCFEVVVQCSICKIKGCNSLYSGGTSFSFYDWYCPNYNTDFFNYYCKSYDYENYNTDLYNYLSNQSKMMHFEKNLQLKFGLTCSTNYFLMLILFVLFF